MMYRILLVAALALALAGCFFPESRRAEADAKAAAAYAKCDNDLRASILKTHVATVNCAAPTVIAAYQEAGYPFEDLITVSLFARRYGADALDAGAISDAEYRRQVGELDKRLAAEEARRLEIMKYGGDPKPTPVESLLAGLPALMPPAAPAAATASRPACTPMTAFMGCK